MTLSISNRIFRNRIHPPSPLTPTPVHPQFFRRRTQPHHLSSFYLWHRRAPSSNYIGISPASRLFDTAREFFIAVSGSLSRRTIRGQGFCQRYPTQATAPTPCLDVPLLSFETSSRPDPAAALTVADKAFSSATPVSPFQPPRRALSLFNPCCLIGILHCQRVYTACPRAYGKW